MLILLVYFLKNLFNNDLRTTRDENMMDKAQYICVMYSSI